jgi:hypothetical protein
VKRSVRFAQDDTFVDAALTPAEIKLVEESTKRQVKKPLASI